jgi:hypothetical protein
LTHSAGLKFIGGIRIPAGLRTVIGLWLLTTNGLSEQSQRIDRGVAQFAAAWGSATKRPSKPGRHSMNRLQLILLRVAAALAAPCLLSGPFAASTVVSRAAPAGALEFQAVTCGGAYPRHLQGVATDGRAAIFWSWTDALVKTDLRGRVLKHVPAEDHQGDLCVVAGKVFVAVNLGKFNESPGKADSWVYVHDAATLDLIARHPVPEVVHGAGGIAHRDGRFLVVGGLPPGTPENYLYEYDAEFCFVKRHVLASGHTDKGIQTATWANGAWWFGCYGTPRVLLRADAEFRFTGRWEFDASLGLEALPDGRFLIGQNTATRGVGHVGRVVIAREDAANGLVFEQP